MNGLFCVKSEVAQKPTVTGNQLWFFFQQFITSKEFEDILCCRRPWESPQTYNATIIITHLWRYNKGKFYFIQLQKLFLDSCVFLTFSYSLSFCEFFAPDLKIQNGNRNNDPQIKNVIFICNLICTVLYKYPNISKECPPCDRRCRSERLRVICF